MATEGSYEDTWIAIRALLTKPGVPISNVQSEQIQTFISIANRWMLDALSAADASDAVFVSTPQTIPAGDVTLQSSAVATAGLLTPRQMWERRAGSTEQWQPMELRHPLPVNAVATTRLRWWDWGNAGEVVGFRFVGATVNVSIKLTFIGRVREAIADPREFVSVLGATDIVAAYAAHLFCLSMQTPQGTASAGNFYAMAKDRLEAFLQRDVKLWQMRPVRSRRPRFGLTHRKGY